MVFSTARDQGLRLAAQRLGMMRGPHSTSSAAGAAQTGGRPAPSVDGGGPTHASGSVLTASRRTTASAAAVMIAVVAVAASALVHGARPTGRRAEARAPHGLTSHAAPAPASTGSSSGATTLVAALPVNVFAGLVSSSPPRSHTKPAAVTGAPAPALAPASQLASSGIPITALTAYRNAAAREAQRTPSCKLPWPLLAGIGRVESNHGRFAGAVLHSDGVSTPPIIGIPLDGHGTALIRDTDHGRLDGDTVFDRAVGPMQFIPSTWLSWGVDANHDGRKDPFNVLDASAAAADYLCAAGRNLSTLTGQVRAVLSYNHSETYVRTVLGLEHVYATATGVQVPILPTTPDASLPGKGAAPKLPPVDPGPPRGVTPRAAPTCGTAPHHPPCPTVSRSASASASPAGSRSPTGSPSSTVVTTPAGGSTDTLTSGASTSGASTSGASTSGASTSGAPTSGASTSDLTATESAAAGSAAAQSRAADEPSSGTDLSGSPTS